MFHWLFDLYRTNPTAQAIAILSLVCVAGMSLGGIAVRGIKLGTSGVLFAAILVGHFGEPIDRHTLEFVKEFGLILFVFCMGMQLGPGFFASLRRSGTQLNVFAAAIVVVGALTAVVMGWLLKLDGAAVLGVFSGATTNTPSLGAAQQTLASFPDMTEDRAALPALAYAVSYPAGIVGIIVTLMALKVLFRIDVSREVALNQQAEQTTTEPLERRTLAVTNANLEGLAIEEILALHESEVVVSRIRRSGETEVRAATAATLLHVDDRLLVVGTSRGLDQFQRVVGQATDENLRDAPGATIFRRVVATNKKLLGKSIRDLKLDLQFGVIVTRVTRGELELTARPALRLQYGDVLQVVGPAEGVDGAAKVLGNSLKDLNQTQFVPLFAGIAAGVALGTLPLRVPGLPQPLKLGLAGGPLIVAILVGRLGRIGRLVWHMPRNANLAFREFGISLFFASVGLMAGPNFFSAVASRAGLLWLIAGICVTVLPLLAVGAFARLKYQMNYVTLAGFLAGSMTDPPALAFANNICQSEAPSVSYATVYPLTTLLRIMAAQILAVILCG